MSVVAPPPHDDPELLIREARARQRRRRITAGTVVVVAGIALGISAVLSVGHSKAQRALPRTALGGSSRRRCRAAQLGLSVDGGGVAAGTAGTRFAFTNRSHIACVLSGWPRFKLVLRDGRQVAPRPHDLIADGYRVTQPPSLPRVVLQPGAGVHWYVNAEDGTGLNRACSWSRMVLVAPPGARAQLTVRAAVPYCSPRSFWVLPIGRKE